jgi:hypothetical protein
MNDTPTPETDAECRRTGHEDAPASYLRADFARQLERERDEARAALKTGGLLDIIDRAGHERAHAIRERDEMKEQCDLLTEQLDFQQKLSREYVDLNTGWRNKWECAVEMAALAEIERDEARATIETLEIRHAAAMLHTQTVVDAHESLERELTKLKQSIANLSHPNCQMLLREIANAADMRYRANKALADINPLEP